MESDTKSYFGKEAGMSIVVPAYNEALQIYNELMDLDCVLKEVGISYEIIIVDDGSSDNTWDEIDKIDFVRKVRHEDNRGYGAAIKTGIGHSKYDWILITDADRTYPSEHIHEMVEYLSDYDMVVGARTGGKVNIPLIRRPAKAFLRGLASYLCGHRIPDINSGLRIMKKELIKKFLHMLPDGFSFTTTITLAHLTNGYKVKYISIGYKPRTGKSKIRPIYDTINFLQLIVRTVLYFNPLKIFLPISLVFLLLSMVMMLYRYIFGGSFLASSIIMFSIGMNALLVGMIADLIDKRTK